MLINNKNAEANAVGIDEFIKNLRDAYNSGRLEYFMESAIKSHYHIFGNIATVLSSYEAKYLFEEEEKILRGINHIQFVKKNKDWLINSIIWDTENDSLKLPDGYIKEMK